MRHAYDVIVAGGGGAGVMAAAAAAQAGAAVALICKEPVGYGNTRMAVGLTACAGLNGDSRDAFIADVLASGQGLSNPHLVETLVEGSRDAMAFLESLGHTFIRSGSGSFDDTVISRAGGHTKSRTLQSSGGGVGMGQVLRAAIQKYGLHVFENTYVTDISCNEGKVCGVRVLDLASGVEYGLSTPAVVLATGGGGWLFYPQTSNNLGSTGDGYALAFRAGAELIDMEQVQLLPFGITHPKAYRGLICGEPAVAGPAGRILDGEGRIVLDGGINAMGRAAVVRKMAEPMQSGRTTAHGGLFLDLRPNLGEQGGVAYRDRVRATGITDSVLPAYGKRAFDWEEPWEVTPTAHFFMGGILANEDGASNVSGLFAAGEAMGGVHGGNRLGSVALTEILVYGLRAGSAAAAYAKSYIDLPPAVSVKCKSPLIGCQGKNRPVHLARELQDVMWRSAGLVRNRDGLLAGLDELDRLKEAATDLAISSTETYNTELRDALELHFMLDVAVLLLTSALVREESRGAHLRSDYPEINPAFAKNIIIRQEDNGKVAHRLKEVGR